MKEIAVEVMPEEIRMAQIKDGFLQEVACERASDEYIVNRIYKGVIRNVLPGTKAAFVDIGLGRNAYMKLEGNKKWFVGESVLVQVVKEEMLGKAARVTMDVSLAGRFMVLLPYTEGLKISKKITDDALRAHLKEMAAPYMESQCGFIIRTAAAKATKEELAHDMAYLHQTYEHIMRRYKMAKVGTELYRDADFWLRLVRDYVSKDVQRIVVNCSAAKARLEELLQHGKDIPEIEVYTGQEPLFEKMGVDEEICALSSSIVELPSGGDLRIDRTEALTVIDVNSKSYLGKNENADDTALAVNKEAALEVCRQIRLRDIGGIIIIDFIDMKSEKHKEALLDLLHRESRKDRVRTVVCGMTKLGLVEMTRKRERQGLMDILTDTCSACGGSGYLLSAQTVYLQIVRKLYQLHEAHRLKTDIALVVHPEVASFFTKNQVKELEKVLSRSVTIELADSSDNREAYSILAV